MNVPSWYQPCLDKIQVMGGSLCPEASCEATSQVERNPLEDFRSVCSCSPPYDHLKVNGVCPFTPETPLPVSKGCFCCCADLAHRTSIAQDSTTYKPIEDFRVGDSVYAADDASLSKWSQKLVRFSAGTGNLTANSTQIKVSYGREGAEDYLLISRNQLFLMPDKTLKPAAKLVPGQDELVIYDGSTVLVNSLEVGSYKQGLHHIATSREPATSLDGHLILAKGVVCGDYALQIALL